MTVHHDRITALRAELAARQLDGFIIPLTDEHMSEYVGPYARRLEWLTGFAGSAGTAVVLRDTAAIFVDGRYTLQVRNQVSADDYQFRGLPAEPVIDWIAANTSAGQRIGYDPWLATRSFVQQAGRAIAAELVAVADNPVDAVWHDQPAPSVLPAEVLPDSFTGRSSADKRAQVAAALRAAGAGHVVIPALDSVAWLFNIRGHDVPRTPVVRAFALVADDGRATLFTDPVKITAEVSAHLGPDVQVRPYGDLAAALAALDGTVLLDPVWSVAAVWQALEAGKAKVIEGRDPVIAPKAAKNPVELDGIRRAHVRDGLAVTRFLHSMAADPAKDEMTAQNRLEAYRRESNLLKDLSFDSISAFGPHAASPHYRCEPETNRAITTGIYLIDSGGQYPDGTTDITRTIAVGTPSAEMRDRFTRVLKGHIALATVRFPAGTRGGALDILARQFLWAAGLDYNHGTGHGVGHYLSVHEGPQRIGVGGANGVEEVLKPGMVLSNEPGFYKDGEYGIRIENLVITISDPKPGDEREMLAFETITLAPIDRRLIDVSLLTDGEVQWLDAYHARVRDTHRGHLDGAALAWLLEATAPLSTVDGAAA